MSSPVLSQQARHAILLGIVLLVEIAVFAAIGANFFRWANALEVIRTSVELGLLALALTPVIVSGGIDLSVGSIMGLCAIVLGWVWLGDDFHGFIGFNPGLVGGIVVALVVGALAGLLNGLLITRLKIPALIVTLGTMSLFRGLAVGITDSARNFTVPLDSSLLNLGNGYWLGWLPRQAPLLVVAAGCYWALMHGAVFGRQIVAIGFSPEGARYAGIPVARRLTTVYVLSGLTAALASIVYVAHLGQAKSDAGTGYELLAITAVVLGGASIFGGRGTVYGTLLGLLVIAVLKQGLQLADLPSSLAGILTGVLLVVTIILNPAGKHWVAQTGGQAEWSMKNSQVAALSIVILLAGLIVAGSNWLLVRSLQDDLLHRASPTAAPTDSPKVNEHSIDGSAPKSSTGDAPKRRAPTIAVMPKSKGNAYFIACKQGAEEAARELGVNMLWDGPLEPDPAAQNAMVENWIVRGVDVIAIAVENREGVSTALRRAREKGIKVVTWDSDAEPDARDYFVNQATPEGIGETLMDHAARVLGGKGQFAIITASLTAGNMIEWQRCIEARRKEKYPDITLTITRPCDDKLDRAKQETATILNAYPDVKLIMAICSPAVPGAAEAVKQSGRDDVKVVGLGLPKDNKAYVHAGITDSVVLWKTKDLGYLTVLAANALYTGALKPGDAAIDAGRLGKIRLEKDNIVLGKPFTFNKSNIDQFDF